MSKRSRKGPAARDPKEAWLELLIPERHITRFTELLREIQKRATPGTIVFREKARGRMGDRVWLNAEAIALAEAITKKLAPAWRRDWSVGMVSMLPPKATLEHLMGKWGRDVVPASQSRGSVL